MRQSTLIRETGKRLALLIGVCGAFPLFCQPVQQVLPNPDCQFFFTLTTANQFLPAGNGFDNRQQGCTTWNMSVNVSGFSGLTVTLQSAANNAGSAGSWGAGFPIQQNTVSGSNAITSTTGGFWWVQGTNAFVRVQLTGVTGTGIVTGAVLGWRIPGAGGARLCSGTVTTNCVINADSNGAIRITTTSLPSCTSTIAGTLVRIAATSVSKGYAAFCDAAAQGIYFWQILYGGQNFLAYSSAWANAAWNLTSSTTPTANAAVAPDDTTTATSLAMTGGYYYQEVTTAQLQGTTWTCSAWLWGSTAGPIGLRLANSGTDASFVSINLTNTPTRYTVTYTFLNTGTAPQCGVDNRSAEGGSGGSLTLNAWGAQLAPGVDRPYQPTTTAIP
jgi:hypothetical protein